MKKRLLALLLALVTVFLCSCSANVPMKEALDGFATVLRDELVFLWAGAEKQHIKDYADEVDYCHYHYQGREAIEKKLGHTLEEVFIKYAETTTYTISKINIPDSGHIFTDSTIVYLFDEGMNLLCEVRVGALNKDVEYRNQAFNSKVAKINEKRDKGRDISADVDALQEYADTTVRVAEHATAAATLLVTSVGAPVQGEANANEWHQLTVDQVLYIFKTVGVY